MSNSLVGTGNTHIDSVLDLATSLCSVASRGTSEAKFHTVGNSAMSLVSSRMVEIDRGNRSLGRSATATTDKLMSLTMMSESPYRAIRQCLAKIESRRSALKENLFNLRKKRVMLEKKKLKISSMYDTTRMDAEDGLNFKMVEIEIEELESGICDSILYIEGAVKEIGVYQDAYADICKNHNIPSDWDENDMEAAEVKHHVRSAFVNGIRDIVAHSRLGMGTMEYLQQFGISPIVADSHIRIFLDNEVKSMNNRIIDNGNEVFDGYTELTDFVDSMGLLFGESYKKVMRRIGLDSIFSPDFAYTSGIDEN